MTGWDWNGDQRELRDAVRSWLDKSCPPSLVRASEPVGFDPGLQRALGSRELFGVCIGEENGGGGGTLTDALVVAVEVGRHLAPSPYADVVAAARLLERSGDAGGLLPGVLAGTDVVTFSPAVAPAGNADLLWPSALASSSVIMLDAGDSVLRPVDPAIEHVPNLGCLPLGRIPAGDSPGKVLAGADESARTRADWQVLLAGMLLGAARAALELGVAYAGDRSAFGRLIGSFQGISHPFADIASALDGAELLASEAAWAVDEQRPRRPVLAAMALLAAAGIAERAAAFSLHAHGGYGFSTEYDIQLYYRRCKGWRLAYVSQESLEHEIAGLLLDAGTEAAHAF